jgi:hypothetical protein
MGIQAMIGREHTTKHRPAGNRSGTFRAGECRLPPTLFGRIKMLLGERSFQPLWITLALFAFLIGATLGVLMWWLTERGTDFAAVEHRAHTGYRVLKGHETVPYGITPVAPNAQGARLKQASS